jgi:divalent metal cation (Fe/Co/Zn/Cd) transporter
VLILAMVFEGAALRVALKEFEKTRRNLPFFKALKASKDSTTIAVVVEDSAALIGLIIALLSVLLGQLTGWVYFDGIGSVLIGVLLVSVAYFFAVECKALLIGEGLDVDNIEIIQAILEAEPNIATHNRPLTLYFGPNEVLVNLDVHFINGLSSDQIEETIDRMEAQIKTAVPKVNRIYIEAETIRRHKPTSPA